MNDTPRTATGPAAVLIVNPHSRGTNRTGLALAEALRGDTGTRIVLLERFARLEQALTELAPAPPEALFISSGDGTVHYIQTWLAERSGLPPERWPILVLLAHGSTNMTAADVGLRLKGVRRKAELIRNRAWRSSSAVITRRPTVRVSNVRGGPQHGMFLGGGAVAEATLYCRKAFHGRGIRGQLGPLLTLLKVGLEALLSPAGPDDVNRIDRPHRMRVLADGELLTEGLQVALLATTLRKLVLGARPFWGLEKTADDEEESAPLRLSVFGWPPPSLLRWLPVVLYGGERRRLPPNMHSRVIRHAEVTTDARFILDGEEMIREHMEEPLIIERGPQMRYLLSA